MLKNNHLLNIVRLLYNSLSTREKTQAGLLCIGMGVGAALETLSLSLIMPFLQLMNHSDMIQTDPRIHQIYLMLGSPKVENFIAFIGFAMLFAFTLKSIYFVGYYYFQGMFFEKKKTSFTRKLLTHYMHSPYIYHLERNSAELIRNISVIGKFIDTVWSPIMLIITESLIMAVILIFLFVVQPGVSFFAIVVIGLSAWGFYKLVRSRIARWAKELFFHTQHMIKWINQSILGIKEIKILGKEEFFVSAYMHHNEAMARIGRNSSTLNQLPRIFIEFVTLTFVIGLVIFVLLTKGLSPDLTATLGLFALAAIRLMPSMNRIMLSTILLKEGTTLSEVMSDCIHELSKNDALAAKKSGKPAVAPTPLAFRNRITFRNVEFSYPKAPRSSVKNINFTIERGKSIAFVGQSGAGKTTVINLLLGLLDPTGGEILIDDTPLAGNIESWQRKIGFIPQQIFISDDTILKNIAFGLTNSKIDVNRAKEVLKTAQLEDFVNSLPDKLESMAGDRGTKLSAGQQQRVGIARALYNDPDVLVLDEATSALDNETERDLSSAIQLLSGKKTLVIIAHRLKTVAHCDKLYFMRDGQIIDSGSYDELIAKNEEFKRFANA